MRGPMIESAIRDLAAILDPISETDFCDNYWEKKPLHTGKPSSRFAALLTQQQFDAILDRGNLRYPAVRVYDDKGLVPKASYLTTWKLGQSSIDDRIDQAALRTHYERGASIFVRSMERHKESIAQLS